MHLQLFCTTGIWQALALACLLSWATTLQNQVHVIPKQAPIHYSKCLSVVGVCKHTATRQPWPVVESPAAASVEKVGRKGRSWQHWKDKDCSVMFVIPPSLHPSNSCDGSPSVSPSLEDPSSPYSVPREKPEPPLAQGEEQRETAYLK